MCFVSTGNPASPIDVQQTPGRLAETSAGSGGRIGRALQTNVDNVAKQLATKAAAKTTTGSSDSTLLNQPDFGFAKKTLLGT